MIQEKMQKKKKKKLNNTRVYITGITEDITKEDIKKHFAQAGIIREDEHREPMIKIYRDEEGKRKGDATITYLKEASVKLAIQLLTNTEIKKGIKIKVEEATTTLIKQQQQTKNKKKKNRKKNQQYAKLDWHVASDDASIGGQRVMILYNVFTEKETIENPILKEEVKEKVKEKTTRYGHIKKIHVYIQDPRGIVKVNFTHPKSAQDAVVGMDQQIIRKRKVKAELWDNKETFTKIATRTEQMERIAKLD